MMKRQRLSQFAKQIVFWCSIGFITSVSAEVAHESLPTEVMINGVEFVHIPAGYFYKTGGIAEDEQKFELLQNVSKGNVKVWLDGYYAAKFEARASDLMSYFNSELGSKEQYVGETISCSIRRGDDGSFELIHPEQDLPATHLNYVLAERWAKWMGFRLLTEFEWEKAARGSDKRIFPWGDNYPDETYAGFYTYSKCYTWPVDSFKKGMSPYGLYNMAGNVREFVSDWYNFELDKNLKAGTRNPKPASQGSMRPVELTYDYNGPWKILKGGRWGSARQQLLISYRNYDKPERPFRCNGTRFALDVSRVKQHLENGSARVITK